MGVMELVQVLGEANEVLSMETLTTLPERAQEILGEALGISQTSIGRMAKLSNKTRTLRIHQVLPQDEEVRRERERGGGQMGTDGIGRIRPACPRLQGTRRCSERKHAGMRGSQDNKLKKKNENYFYQ